MKMDADLLKLTNKTPTTSSSTCAAAVTAGTRCMPRSSRNGRANRFPVIAMSMQNMAGPRFGKSGWPRSMPLGKQHGRRLMPRHGIKAGGKRK